MFRLPAHTFLDRTIDFPSSDHPSNNAVDIVIGDNGTGKTSLLVSLADAYTGARAHLRHGHLPARVITQTFSPFSRFRAPKRTTQSWSDNYFEETDKPKFHVSVGFHRGNRQTGSGMTRSLIEECIFDFAREWHGHQLASSSLQYLGFGPSIDITYKVSPVLQDRYILEDSIRRLADPINSVSTASRGRYRSSPLPSALIREVRSAEAGLVIDRIAFAADVLELGRKYRSVSLGFDLENGRRSLNPAQLQALVFLRRLKLVDIRACLLMRNNFARVEVGSISSGQQQTMCTSFGLMAKLRDNSLVLVDDPEIGLHPRMQQEFCGHLASALAPFKGCHVVIATHSALLVQRASEMKYGVISLNKPRGRVTETGAVTVPLYVDESRSVESVLFDNFDTPILNSNLIPNELFRIAVELDYAGVTERALLIERLAEIEAAYVDRKDAIRERRLIELAKDIIRQDDDRRSSTEHHG